MSTRYGSVAINLEAYEETNGNLSGGGSELFSRKASKATTNGLKNESFMGYNARYSTNTTITGGIKNARPTESRRSGESAMVIIQEEIRVESRRATPTSEIEVIGEAR